LLGIDVFINAHFLKFFLSNYAARVINPLFALPGLSRDSALCFNATNEQTKHHYNRGQE
jgi:hypothetical protein